MAATLTLLGLVWALVAACGEGSGPVSVATAPPDATPESSQATTGTTELPRELERSEVDTLIIAYLNCLDFDCAETLDAVASAGSVATPVLLELLESGPPPDLSDVGRAAANIRLVAALGAIGDPMAVPGLLRVLDAPDPVLRAETVGALSMIGGADALDAVVQGLKDPDQLVREMAANGLAKLEDPAALPALREALLAEELPHVARAIDNAIRTIEAG